MLAMWKESDLSDTSECMETTTSLLIPVVEVGVFHGVHVRRDYDMRRFSAHCHAISILGALQGAICKDSGGSEHG